MKILLLITVFLVLVSAQAPPGGSALGPITFNDLQLLVPKLPKNFMQQLSQHGGFAKHVPPEYLKLMPQYATNFAANPKTFLTTLQGMLPPYMRTGDLRPVIPQQYHGMIAKGLAQLKGQGARAGTMAAGAAAP